MLIECPECHQTHTLTTEQFQSSDGTINCPGCSAQFDPITHLSKADPEQSVINEQSQVPFPWEKTRTPISESFWSYGVIAGISLLAAQFFYFKNAELAQNQTIRPWLEQTCVMFRCQLPMYRNIKEFSVLHSSFIESKHYYTLQAAILNQAEFSQQYPNLKLTLLNFSGSPIAQRIFQPDEYFNQKLPAKVLNKSETFTIKLDIALLAAKTGGFTIELI